MNVLGLFSGIGGFEYGLQNVGYNIKALCEIEPYPLSVLEKNFPTIPIINDVRNINKDTFTDEVDVIVGGFPCTDISKAGKMKGGIQGEKSGLWFEFRRIINDIKPRYAIIENVNSILGNGLGTVLSNLAEIGYDATYQTIDTKYFGLPQRRRRTYIIAVRDGIPTDTEIFEFAECSTEKHRFKIKTFDKSFKWDFREQCENSEQFAYFTKTRNNEYNTPGLAKPLLKMDNAIFSDLIFQDNIIRGVSIQERMLLQGFPIDWLDIEGSLSSQYKCNGMSVPVIEYIGLLLQKFDKIHQNQLYVRGEIDTQSSLFNQKTNIIINNDIIKKPIKLESRKLF